MYHNSNDEILDDKYQYKAQSEANIEAERKALAEAESAGPELELRLRRWEPAIEDSGMSEFAAQCERIARSLLDNDMNN